MGFGGKQTNKPNLCGGILFSPLPHTHHNLNLIMAFNVSSHQWEILVSGLSLLMLGWKGRPLKGMVKKCPSYAMIVLETLLVASF